jgi:hypothetical protein
MPQPRSSTEGATTQRKPRCLVKQGNHVLEHVTLLDDLGWMSLNIEFGDKIGREGADLMRIEVR